ncbi:MAG: hypothetical protein Q9180_003770 [Flavoplaca navasiana]
MSSKRIQKTQPDFYGYPAVRQSPETPPYTVPSGSNPVLRGLPLAIVGTIASKLNFVGNFLWTNTGFGLLRDIRDLDDYEPRYDPTVIKLSDSLDGEPIEETISNISIEYQTISNRHYSAAYFTSAYKAGKLTPTEVITGLLDQISAEKRHSVAFLQIIPEKVIAAAEASTARYKSGKPLSLLDGVPVAVKDEADLDGYEKSLGSSIDYTRKNGGTSWCIKKWEDAGAIIIGVTNMHELGLGISHPLSTLPRISAHHYTDTTNNNPVKGTPLNPHNPSYYTGGSSGGSAYAVASGLVPIAHGADGGGSIRIPAAYCGLYGLKPTHGRVSILPTKSLATSNGVMGPLASNMADLELAYRILATPDPSNPTSSLFNPPSPLPSPSSKTNRPKTLGIYNPWFSASSPKVLSACNEALDHYTSSLSYRLIPIHLPHMHSAQLAHALTILSEISSGTPPSLLPSLSAANKILLSVGALTPATDFLLAQKMRALLMSHLAWLWKEYPGMLIVSPTTPNAGWRIGGGGGDLKYGVYEICVVGEFCGGAGFEYSRGDGGGGGGE